jgi:aminopeptidase N
MTFTRSLFPPYAVDAAYLDTAQLAADETAPVVRNTLLERSDTVRRMLHSRGRQG